MNTFLVHHVLLPEVDYCELDQLLHVDRRGQEARELPEHGGQLAHELVQAGFHAGGDVAEGAEVGRRHSGEDPGVDAVRGGPGRVGLRHLGVRLEHVGVEVAQLGVVRRLEGLALVWGIGGINRTDG